MKEKNLDQILEFLKIGRQKFNEMDKKTWNDLVARKLKTVNDEAQKQQWGAICANLSEQIKRKEVLVLEAQSQKYTHLYTKASGTPSHTARQEEKESITNESSTLAISSVDDDGNINTTTFTVTGGSPAEIAANKAAILAAYKEFIEANYTDADDRKDYQVKEDLFKTFKDLKDNPLFKNLPERDKNYYENMKDNFPMKVTMLPFKNTQDAENFMKKMQDDKRLKSSAEVVEQTKKAADIKNETSSTSATTTPTPTPFSTSPK